MKICLLVYPTFLSHVTFSSQFHHAAKLYQKLRRPEEASRCHEQVLHFDQAVDVLVASDMFDKAIDVVGRYQMLMKV